MKIGIAYPAFFSSFKAFYPELEVIKDIDTVTEYDLVIFSGGSDISPSFYGENNRYSSCDDKRDDVEKNILSVCLNNRVKVFGACRGHQLINARLGGRMAQDIQFDLQERHPGTHKLSWVADPSDGNMISTLFSTVNSMHHQAVTRPGNGLNVAAKMGNKIVEVTYNDDIFSVQFHPEWMQGSEPFFEWIRKWAEGSSKKKSAPKQKAKKVVTNQSADIEWTSMPREAFTFQTYTMGNAVTVGTPIAVPEVAQERAEPVRPTPQTPQEVREYVNRLRQAQDRLRNGRRITQDTEGNR